MKKKVFLGAFLFILILIIGNIVYGKAYSTDYVSITIPDSYSETYSSVDDDSEWITYWNSNYTKEVHWDVYTRYGRTVYTEEYLAGYVEDLKELYTDDDTTITILKQEIIENNGVLGMRVAYKTYYKDYGSSYYYDRYYFLTDNYEVELYFYSNTSSYINSSEEQAIVKSFKIKDTVLESRGEPFTDVSSDAWYLSAVKYTYEKGYILRFK